MPMGRWSLIGATAVALALLRSVAWGRRRKFWRLQLGDGYQFSPSLTVFTGHIHQATVEKLLPPRAQNSHLEVEARFQTRYFDICSRGFGNCGDFGALLTVLFYFLEFCGFLDYGSVGGFFMCVVVVRWLLIVVNFCKYPFI